MWKERKEREGGKKRRKRENRENGRREYFCSIKSRKKKPLVQYVAAESVDFPISIV